MKTRNFNLLCIIVALFLGIISCTPKSDDVDPATLSVAPGELTFANTSGEQVIKITTNQESWVSTSPQEGSWIELVPAGNNLTVKVKENTVAEIRSTYIIVSAGAATPQKVKVTQNPADVVLELTPEAINVPNTGGTYTVDISSNNDLWSIELTEPKDWLTMSIHKTAKMAYITIQANETTEERTAVLRATNKTKSIELLIKQAAASNTRYLMPLIKKKPTGREISTYEISQKSILKAFFGANPMWNIPDDQYIFITGSDLFEEIEYSVREATGSLVKINTFSRNYEAVVKERTQIIDFYKNNDFEIVSEKEDIIRGKHKTLPFNITMEYIKDEGMSIKFEQYAVQSESYKTFSTFPDAPIIYLNKPEWKLDKIIEMELARGATENGKELVARGKHKGEVALIQFKQVEASLPFILSAYFFNWAPTTADELLGTVGEIANLYSDVSLAFWLDSEITAGYIPTKEFMALMEKEGWAYQGFENGFHYFHNQEKNISVACLAVLIRGLNNGEPCVQISLFRPKGGNGSQVKLLGEGLPTSTYHQ